MKKLLGPLVCAVLLFSCKDDTKVAADNEVKPASDATTAAPADYEIADTRFVDIAKKGFRDLESGDIDSWGTNIADNAIYRWNNLDSLVGKPAIIDYWKKRRAEVIDSMSFTGDVWLPVKVNKPQTPVQLTGNYALSWHMVYAKYSTGKSMTQRVHTIYHFDANDKIDRVFQYLDRAPIMEAMKK